MNKTHILAIAAALLVAPMAMAHDPIGTPKEYCESRTGVNDDWGGHEYGPGGQAPALPPPSDGSAGRTCPDSPSPTGDGHDEYALGGAWILVESGLGEASSDPNVGAGTLYCWGAAGHHNPEGAMHVADLILGTTVTFTIAADRDDLTGLGEGCGDLLADEHTPCGGYGCWPAFPPGLDGTYQVYVEGSQGHVLWETL